MILDLVETLGGWTWWIIGLVLLALEIVLPGTFFLWFGVAAIIVGSATLIFAWAWQVQLIIFIVLALVLVVLGRRYFSWGRAAPETLVNERGAQLVGSTYVLAEPIVDGHGRVRIADTMWRIVGPDLPSGRRIRVVGADGAILRVEPA